MRKCWVDLIQTSDPVPSTAAEESLVSGYDPHINSAGTPAQTGDRDVYQSVVVTNVDGNLSPALLRAAAMEHIKKDLKGARYIQVPHGKMLLVISIIRLCCLWFFRLCFLKYGG